MIRGSDVTVVIPTIPGREDLLWRAVQSVKTQELRPATIEVDVDVDRTGAAQTRNRAVERVKTEWIAWLDDDDELLPNHIRVLVRGANKSRADLIYSYAQFIGGRDPLGCWHNGVLVPEPINVPFDNEAMFALRRDGNHIPITYLVRTEAVRKVGGFPERNSNPDISAAHSGDCEDYLLLINLLDAGYKFHHVCGVRTWIYHFHQANTGGRGREWLYELEQGSQA